MRKLYILNGLPGSGKGTQAEMVANDLSLVHISSGQLIRDAIKSATSDQFTKSLKSRYDQGLVQPDDVAIKLIEKKISSLQPDIGVVFDSFPINLSQAKLLENLITKEKFDRPTFIMLNITPDEAVNRLSTRKICSMCGSPFIDKDGSMLKCGKCGATLTTRTDDKESVVRKRIQEYLPLLKDLSSYYREKGRLLEIDGEKSIADVFEDIKQKLNGQ